MDFQDSGSPLRPVRVAQPQALVLPDVIVIAAVSLSSTVTRLLARSTCRSSPAASMSRRSRSACAALRASTPTSADLCLMAVRLPVVDEFLSGCTAQWRSSSRPRERRPPVGALMGVPAGRHGEEEHMVGSSRVVDDVDLLDAKQQRGR